MSISSGKSLIPSEPKGESEFNQQVMKKMDKIHTENTGRGAP